MFTHLAFTKSGAVWRPCQNNFYQASLERAVPKSLPQQDIAGGRHPLVFDTDFLTSHTTNIIPYPVRRFILLSLPASGFPYPFFLTTTPPTRLSCICVNSMPRAWDFHKGRSALLTPSSLPLSYSTFLFDFLTLFSLPFLIILRIFQRTVKRPYNTLAVSAVYYVYGCSGCSLNFISSGGVPSRNQYQPLISMVNTTPLPQFFPFQCSPIYLSISCFFLTPLSP